jgi:hypothetical protein
MIYRIVTEDKGNDELISLLVLPHFEGFSISKQTGYYKGHKEASLVIEIDTLADDNAIGVYRLAESIKITLNQECVLVQRIQSISELV